MFAQRHWFVRITPLLLAAAVATLSGCWVSQVAAAQLEVGSRSPKHKTISSAIKAARPGDVILVRAGSYREAVTVPSGITLRGQGKVRIIAKRPLRVADARDVVIDNISVMRLPGKGGKGRPSPAMEIKQSQKVVLRACELTVDSGIGILFSGCKQALVEKCVVYGKGKTAAIFFSQTTGKAVGNILSGHQTGIYVQDRSAVEINGNFLGSNQVGISGHASAMVIADNTITGKEGNGVSVKLSRVAITGNALRRNRFGIKVEKCIGILAGNIVSQNLAGVIVRASPLKIFNNTIFFNRAEGLVLRGVIDKKLKMPQAEVFQNVISNNCGTGLALYGFRKAHIHHNLIYANRSGVELDRSAAKVINNTVVLNKSDGLVVKSGSDAMLSANIVAYNTVGITLDVKAKVKSGYNNVYGNLASKTFPLFDGNYSRLDRLPTQSGEVIHIGIMPAYDLKGGRDVSVDPGFVKIGEDFRIRSSSPLTAFFRKRPIGALPLAKGTGR